MCTTRDHVCILALYYWVVAAMCYVLCVQHSRSDLYLWVVSAICFVCAVYATCAPLKIKLVSLWYLHPGSYHHFISIQAGCLTGQGGRIILWSDICVWNLMLYICIQVFVFISINVVYIGSLLTKHNSCITLWQPSPDEENRPRPRAKTHFYFCFYLGLSW